MLIVIAIGGLVQGSTGFGSGLVSLGILTWIVGMQDTGAELLGSDLEAIKLASILITFAALSQNVIIIRRLWRHFKWERMGPMIVCTMIGAPIGVYVLVKADADVLKVTLGIVLVIAAAQAMIPHLAKKRWHPWYMGIPFGLFTGGLNGAIGTGGPPAVAYIASQNFTRFRYSVMLQVVFGVSCVIRLGLIGAKGMLTWQLMLMAVGAIVFAGIGAATGLRVLRRFSDAGLKKVVAVLLLVLGLWYLKVFVGW